MPSMPASICFCQCILRRRLPVSNNASGAIFPRKYCSTATLSSRDEPILGYPATDVFMVFFNL